MTISNVQYYNDMSFADYLAHPGLSYSGLKEIVGRPIIETDKMRLGTAVHNYLLTPGHFATTLHLDPKVRVIALKLVNALGGLLKHLQPEVAVTADFENQGFIMKWKGRIDLVIPGRMVIDIKITELPIHKAIEFFRYDRPISGYCLATGSPLGFIVSVHPKNFNTEIVKVPIDTHFWNEKILEMGTPQLSRPEEEAA